MVHGYYYLHVNGDLIYKAHERPDVGGFVRAVWPVNTTDRRTAWTLVVEATALGARQDRVDAMVAQWGLTDNDGLYYAGLMGLNLEMDGDRWCATFDDFENLQESQAGFGDTALAALAGLAKGGTPRPQMWGPEAPNRWRAVPLPA